MQYAPRGSQGNESPEDQDIAQQVDGIRVRIAIEAKTSRTREGRHRVGANWKENVGATHRLAIRESPDPPHFVIAVGLRAWF